jgi:menaquinone-specific isochorismate synthase
MKAVCFPLPDTTNFDPFDFGCDSELVFVGPDRAMVGLGVALTVNPNEADALLAAIPCDDQVERPGSGVVAHGALPFSPDPDQSLIVPRVSVVRETGGVAWATLVADDADPFDRTLLDRLLVGERRTDSVSPAAQVRSAVFRPDPTIYEAAVALAVQRIAQSDLGKVVLARGVDIELSEPLSCLDTLRRLHRQEPLCAAFSYPVTDGRFLGASPELLVAVAGKHVTCHPLAGTVGLTGQPDHDAASVAELASSPKSANEHRYVVDEIARGLAPWCDDITYAKQPAVVHLRSVAHLGTEMTARLRARASVLQLLAALHPTPAVGGVPRPEALDAIAELEPEPRKQWAGPVGWVDAKGNGEWFIGIRSATVSASRLSVHLHAGAGIVAGSEPAAELAETSIKLAPLLEAVAPGARLN